MIGLLWKGCDSFDNFIIVIDCYDGYHLEDYDNHDNDSEDNENDLEQRIADADDLALPLDKWALWLNSLEQLDKNSLISSLPAVSY